MTLAPASRSDLRLAMTLDSSKAAAAAYTLTAAPSGSHVPPLPKIHGFAKVDAAFVARTGPKSLREASDAILELTESLENQTGEHFSDVVVSFASPTLRVGGESVRLPLKQERIGHRELQELERLWTTPNSGTGPDMVHNFFTLRSAFRVDRHCLTLEPEGLAASTLSRTELTFSDRRTTLLNWIEAFRLCGLRVRRFLPQPLGSLLAATSPYERKQGIMVVDIGHSYTQVIVCRDHLVRDFRIHPIGGDRITEDLSICLQISPNEAEELKRNCMSVRDAAVPHDAHHQDTSLAPDIIAARAAELAKLVRSIGETSFRARDYVAGVVLVGGSAKMTGLVQEFRSQVHPLCRVASKFSATGMHELLDDPSLASLSGTILADTSTEEFTQILDQLPLEPKNRRNGPLAKLGRFLAGRPQL